MVASLSGGREGGFGSCLMDIMSQFGENGKSSGDWEHNNIDVLNYWNVHLKMVTILKIMYTYHEKKKKAISLYDLLWKSGHTISTVYYSLDLGSFVNSFSIKTAFQRSVLPIWQIRKNSLSWSLKLPQQVCSAPFTLPAFLSGYSRKT